METKVGFQGDRKQFEYAKKKYDNLQKYLHDFKSYDDYREVQNRIMVVITWEDSLSNLSYVLKHVKPNAPNIIGMKITPVIRKGRRDVYILSEDNEKFDKVFHEILTNLRKKIYGY